MIFRVKGIINREQEIVLLRLNRMQAEMAPNWPKVESAAGFMCEMEGANPVRAVFQLGLPVCEGTTFRCNSINRVKKYPLLPVTALAL